MPISRQTETGNQISGSAVPWLEHAWSRFLSVVPLPVRADA